MPGEPRARRYSSPFPSSPNELMLCGVSTSWRRAPPSGAVLDAAPDAARAVVAEEVDAGERGKRIAPVAVAAGDRAPERVVVLEHRQGQCAVVAAARGQVADRALHAAPTRSCGRRRAGAARSRPPRGSTWPTSADPQVPRHAVEGEAPGVAQPERPDLRPGPRPSPTNGLSGGMAYGVPASTSMRSSLPSSVAAVLAVVPGGRRRSPPSPRPMKSRPSGPNASWPPLWFSIRLVAWVRSHVRRSRVGAVGVAARHGVAGHDRVPGRVGVVDVEEAVRPRTPGGRRRSTGLARRSRRRGPRCRGTAWSAPALRRTPGCGRVARR